MWYGWCGKCAVLAQFEIEELEKEYIAIASLDQFEDTDEDEEVDAEVTFLRFEETYEGTTLETVSDDEEFEIVRAAFEAITAEDE